MRNLKTIAVPEELESSIYSVVLDSLLSTIEKQNQQIAHLTKMAEKLNGATAPHYTYRTPSGRRAARHYKSTYHAAFGGYISHAPVDVREYAKKIRDNNGYKAGVHYLQEWWEKNNKRAKTQAQSGS